ncbi:DedA family protein [Microvirga sp. 2TAF3]|uniref:DedA family protein n=1 Tax=Microvirga sp. 2TAF3 TaxID=3233014 RepID=UPI003F9C8100
MSIQEASDIIIGFVRNHEAWAIPIVFALAFGESLAFISLLLPATVVLLGIGALIGKSGIAFWPLWASAMAGAALGDWVSFWIGLRLKHDVARIWPLSRHPELLPRAHAFFERWGALGVFIGRFFGPLRAAVPLVAGVCGMSVLPFQLANFASAAVWAAGILAPGVLGVQWLEAWLG